MSWKVLLLSNGTRIIGQYSLGKIDPSLIEKVFVCDSKPYDILNGAPVDELDNFIECTELTAQDFVDLDELLATKQRVYNVGDKVTLDDLPAGLYKILYNGTEVASVVSTGKMEFTVTAEGVYSIILDEKPCNEFTFTVHKADQQPVQF
ncbi:MAG: hypothetical protein QXE80_08775 [Pyrobaculum sp.]